MCLSGSVVVAICGDLCLRWQGSWGCFHVLALFGIVAASREGRCVIGRDVGVVLIFGIAPRIRSELGIVHGWIAHVGFGLIKAHVHHILQDGYIGGLRELQGFWRGWREDTWGASEVWLVRGF